VTNKTASSPNCTPVMSYGQLAHQRGRLTLHSIVDAVSDEAPTLFDRLIEWR
jgi:hypothetical protein